MDPIFSPRFSVSVIVCNYYNSQAVFGFGFGYGSAGGVGWPGQPPGWSLNFLHIKSFLPVGLVVPWNDVNKIISAFCSLSFGFWFYSRFVVAFFIPLFYDTLPRK